MPSAPETSGNNQVVDNNTRPPSNLKIPPVQPAKYTDVTRTSSASFKPPMSKDPVLKKKTDTPHTDSTWFTPISYIKNMFGGKPSDPTTAQVSKTEKNKKSPPVKNTSNVVSAKAHKLLEDQEKPVSIAELTPVPTVLSENHLPSTLKQEYSPRFSYTASEASGRKPVGEKRVATKVEEENDPNAPKYNALRFVENKSTYLHTPEKKGTTSFRITTSSKVKTKPCSSSPKLSKRAKTTTRQSSASPKKIPHADSGAYATFPTRLRSKSTPDHSSVKQRLNSNPVNARIRNTYSKNQDSPKRSWSPKFTDQNTGRSVSLPSHQLKVLSWLDYEKTRRAKEAARNARKERAERAVSPPKAVSESNIKKTSSNSSFITKNNEDQRSVSPTRKAIENFMGAAIDALSTKISTITKPQDAVESPPTKNKEIPPVVHESRSETRTSKARSETSIPRDPPQETPTKSTWFGRFFEDHPSPILEQKLKSQMQKREADAPTEQESKVLEPEFEYVHKRPSDISAYIKKEKKNKKTLRRVVTDGRTPVISKARSLSPSPRPKKSSSLTGGATSPTANSPGQRRSTHNISRSSSTKNFAEEKAKSQKEISFKSLLSTFSATVQDKFIPNFYTEREERSSAELPRERGESPKSFSYYIKKKPKSIASKHKKGASKTILTSGKSPKDGQKMTNAKVKETSSFLKSRQDAEPVTRSHHSVHGFFNSPPKMTAVSRYNRSESKHNF